MALADLVIRGGKVATVDDRFSFAEAIAVRNGRIIDVSSDNEIKTYIGRSTKTIDLDGQVVLPAAGDGHVHAAHTGFSCREDYIHLDRVESVKELQDLLAAAAKTKRPGEWLFGSGFHEYAIKKCLREKRQLTRWDLDPVTPDNPVALLDGSLHNLVVNTKGLQAAHYDLKHPPLRPEVGSLSYGRNGEITGRFEEFGAQAGVLKFVPALSDAELEDCICRAQQLFNAEGITSHTDIVGPGGRHFARGTWGEKVITAYENMRREGRLTARVNCHLFAAVDGIHSYDSIMKGLDQVMFEAGDEQWVRAGCVKLFGDNMSRWQRDGKGGRSMFPGETDEEQRLEIERTVLELHRKGWQIGTHAIGGRMIDVIVNSYRNAQQRYPREAPRHFVIHGDDLTAENVKIMAGYKIGLTAQPIAFPTVAYRNAPYMARGEEMFDWQGYLEQGVAVAGSSDSPIFTPNWRRSLQCAVTRRLITGDVMRDDLAMCLEDAIRMYTINAARQEHAEKWRGSIEIGKVADFQVLDKDIFAVDRQEIGSIKVVMTICDGKIVYEAQ